MSNLEIIKTACVKANESIMDLQFGCEIKDVNAKDILIIGQKIIKEKTPYKQFVGIIKSIGLDTGEIVIFHKGHIDKILGKKIELPDVLLAIKNQYEYFDEKYRRDVIVFIHSWNLLKSLEDQDEPTLSFIASLLK